MAATSTNSSDTVIVRESFYGRINGEDRVFRTGELIRATDPAVKKWPAFFGPAEFQHEAAIERATAAPGEKR